MKDGEAELGKAREILKTLSQTKKKLRLIASPPTKEAQRVVDIAHRAQVRIELQKPTSSITNITSVQIKYPTIGDIIHTSEEALQNLYRVGPVNAGYIAEIVKDLVIAAKRRPLRLPFPDELKKEHAEIIEVAWGIYQSKKLNPQVLDKLSKRRVELKRIKRRLGSSIDRPWKIFGKDGRKRKRQDAKNELIAWRKSSEVSTDIDEAVDVTKEAAFPKNLDGIKALYRKEFSNFTAILEQLGVEVRQSEAALTTQPEKGNKHQSRRDASGEKGSSWEWPIKAPKRRSRSQSYAEPITWREKAKAAAERKTSLWDSPVSEKSQWGGLPKDLAKKIENYAVKTDYLKATLRPYQEFGVAFAALQRRVVLGDEMGLGKTIEALGLMSHISSQWDGTHFLVVCPASILGNWIHEVETHSRLDARLIHGTTRDADLARWCRLGGVAVTSYSTARSIGHEKFGKELSLVVADECHYVKNREAGRTFVFSKLAEKADRVLLMSGTPMENRVEEFIDVIRVAKPSHASLLETRLMDSKGLNFHRDVAPVYLRRKQADVLKELPRLVEMDEWIQLPAEEMRQYRKAESESHIMSIRRRTTVGGSTGSQKLERLDEILGESRREGFKVVVFSYFLEVLDLVDKRVKKGFRIDGSVSANKRFSIIKKFSETEGHAVLTSQVISGGVGLNIQSANVVILMEPQVKPTTEWQAIARVYRMGQTRTVLVYRLLARDTVDQDLFDLVSSKAKDFYTYADPSLLKEHSTKSVASSESEIQGLLEERVRSRKSK